jgi:peptidoglycan hydrolase-like protein with peptidoglycan-binding domain
MTYSLTWLPEVLQKAGLKVALVDGWSTRGRAEMGKVKGVICHHTATRQAGNMPTLKTLINGRDDLPGPLAQLGLGRDGTFYVVAAGRCNHAGPGAFEGITSGNTNFIGIEAENSGMSDDRWPEVQITSYQRGVAAILKHVGATAAFCIGHKEFALPPGRKSDPNFDMNVFRSGVADIMSGSPPAPLLIPSIEPVIQPGSLIARPTIRRGAIGPLVEKVQVKCGVVVDGHFGAKTEAALRIFQGANNLVPDGIVGPETWRALD